MNIVRSYCILFESDWSQPMFLFLKNLFSPSDDVSIFCARNMILIFLSSAYKIFSSAPCTMVLMITMTVGRSSELRIVSENEWLHTSNRKFNYSLVGMYGIELVHCMYVRYRIGPLYYSIQVY